MNSTHENDDIETEINPFTVSHQSEGEEIHAELQNGMQKYHLQSRNVTILIRQLPAQGLSFQLWPAANTLVTLLDNHKSHSGMSPLSSVFDSSVKQRILELGSGTGVVGIAAAALLNADVKVTDLPHVLPNLRFNVDANSGILGGGSVQVAALSWGNAEDMEAIGEEYDVILGSDVVYHEHLYEPLLETLKFFLLRSEKDRKIVFLMAHLKRWKKENVFFKKARKFFHIDVLYNDVPSGASRVGVAVYRFVRKEAGKL